MKPMKTTIRTCPVCTFQMAWPLTDFKYLHFDDCGLDGTMDLVVCSKCGGAYLDTISTGSAFTSYYRQQATYGRSSTTGAGGDSSEEQRRFSEIAVFCGKYLTSESAAILDIGSGRGGLLKQFSRTGYTNCHALDLSPACIDHIRQRYGFNAAVGEASDIPFSGIAFNLIVCSHIIEHALTPEKIIAECKNRLTDDGLIYIEVPDAAQYGVNVSAPFADFYFEHINHFDPVHLDMLLKINGMEPLEHGCKRIEASGGLTVACVYGLYRKNSTFSNNSLHFDHYLGVRLSDYISSGKDHALFSILNEVARSKTPLHIWGMSQYAQFLLGSSPLNRCSIKSLIDADPKKQQRTISGMRIHSPESLRQAATGDAIILTALGYQENMRQFLREINFRGMEFSLD